jgi:hypothetical protein
MAALAEALEVPHPVVLRIMVQMSCRKNDPRPTQVDSFEKIRPACGSAMIVAPRLGVAVEPAAIRQALYYLAVWTAASFANTTRALIAYTSADVGPVSPPLCNAVPRA